MKNKNINKSFDITKTVTSKLDKTNKKEEKDPRERIISRNLLINTFMNPIKTLNYKPLYI